MLEGESWPGNKVLLVEGTGFTSVQYNSQGRNPKYQSDIFELQVLNQNGLDITQRDLTFNWSTYGQVWDGSTWKEVSVVDIIEDNTLSTWKKRIQPKSEWSGECVTAGVKVDVYQATNYIATLKIPIHGYLNRSMNQAIEGWNGNSIQLKQSGGYLYAPQIGTGKKESDESFTGMIMGKAKEENVEKIGLLGYNHGEQSLFLDAESGGAIFGKGSQGGQLAFDPNTFKSLLYSKNYWEQYNAKGFPKSYDDTNKKGQGMVIDLTTPEIVFGNGKSKITKDGFLEYEGNLTSKGIFTQLKYIAGWDYPGNGMGVAIADLYSEFANISTIRDYYGGRPIGLSYGTVGFMPCAATIVQPDSKGPELPSTIQYFRKTLCVPITLPQDFEIERVTVKCQYRKYQEEEFSSLAMDPNKVTIDDK